jgi:hypothetical protein
MTRATLHDELMREAGFETDYHRDLDRRREHRHHLRLRAVAGLPWLVLGVAGIVELWGKYFPGIPRPVVIGAIGLGFVVNAVLFVRDRLLPWMGDQA